MSSSCLGSYPPGCPRLPGCVSHSVTPGERRGQENRSLVTTHRCHLCARPCRSPSFPQQREGGSLGILLSASPFQSLSSWELRIPFLKTAHQQDCAVTLSQDLSCLLGSPWWAGLKGRGFEEHPLCPRLPSLSCSQASLVPRQSKPLDPPGLSGWLCLSCFWVPWASSLC